jgi:tRNA (cmo5U34)-methyltransferase
MRSEELRAVFDQQAAGYDRNQERMAPILEALYFLLEPALSDLPDGARILCVGAGTGTELGRLARKFPGWMFTAVEPSKAMLDVCRQRAKAEGFSSRCHFHEGYLDSLPEQEPYDGATCFLVSQFILKQEDRSGFFRAISDRLKPGGMLASSDLASGSGSNAHEALLAAWMKMMAAADVPPEGLERMRAAYDKDVAVLPAEVVGSLITSGGFKEPVQFFQAGLLHAWLSKRASSHAN